MFDEEVFINESFDEMFEEEEYSILEEKEVLDAFRQFASHTYE
jgi:hypothetical protein